MKNQIPSIKLLFFTFLFGTNLHAQKFSKIPTQSINFQEYIGKEKSPSALDTIPSYEISNFITYKEYKVYLEAIKKDSSHAYYLSQRPDSGIAAKAEIYSKYVNSNTYDNEPVVGISWESAMNYCRWKTIKDNPKDSIEFIYRIPIFKEWIAAYHYFIKNNIKHDMNAIFSDWLLENYFENWTVDLNAIYFHQKSDYSSWKRKITIGNSYLFSVPSPLFHRFWFFAGDGQRHLSFRIIKQSVDNNIYSTNYQTLQYWNLKEDTDYYPWK